MPFPLAVLSLAHFSRHARRAARRSQAGCSIDQGTFPSTLRTIFCRHGPTTRAASRWLRSADSEIHDTPAASRLGVHPDRRLSSTRAFQKNRVARSADIDSPTNIVRACGRRRPYAGGCMSELLVGKAELVLPVLNSAWCSWSLARSAASCRGAPVDIPNAGIITSNDSARAVYERAGAGLGRERGLALIGNCCLMRPRPGNVPLPNSGGNCAPGFNMPAISNRVYRPPATTSHHGRPPSSRSRAEVRLGLTFSQG